MLKFMRKYATGYLVKALFGVIIVVFIFWGVGSFRETEEVVAKVGPYKVSKTEYRDNYNRLVNFYRMMFRERFDESVAKEMKLRERAMDQLVDQYVLLIKAKEIGIKVSDREFAEYLTRLPEFQRDGKFSQSVYLEVLRRNNIDPKNFEIVERRSMLRTKVGNMIGDLATSVSDEALWDRYVRDRGQVNLTFVEFSPADYAGKVSVSEKEIADRYEKDKALLRSENTYRLKQVVIDAKSGLKDDAVYMELLKSKDLEGYAQQKGLQVQDMGTLRESELSKKFGPMKLDEALKGVRAGEVTLPIRAGDKSYIFQLVERREGKPLEKAEAAREIGDMLKKEKAKEMARVMAEEAIEKKAVTGKKETGFVGRNVTALPGAGQFPKEHSGLLGLNEKNPIYGKPVEIAGKYYSFAFKAQKTPDRGEWDKEKGAYKQQIIAQAREEMVGKLIAEMKKGEKIEIRWEEI